MGKKDLNGEMGIDVILGQCHMTLIIQNHIREDAALSGVMGCSWALIGAPGAQDALFRVPRNE